jgi:hypothetical protein
VLGALALFAGAAVAIAALWNRWFLPVSWRLVALMMALAAGYQAETLFTNAVDLPARLAFRAQPWQSTGVEAVHANTGIVFTQLAPWTRTAREQLLRGDLPLWNRYSASGAPLLANQQTAIFHPFTLLGLPLSIGKAFTLSATLRLFTLLFFTFVFLRKFAIGDGAALFGAVAYTFSTFHIVWLLFPLGLSTMMLPVALAGAQGLESRAGYLLLVIGLSLSVLGGHPEQALWVWLTTAAFIAVMRKRVLFGASAFLIAMLLTAFFWYPTLRALESTSRFAAFQSSAANPADHGLSYEWLLPLVRPNILGTPQEGTYRPPRGAHPAVLNDYGEVASGYAGLITLVLALVAPFRARGRAVFFGLGLMAFALLTIAEVPVWRDVIRAIPLVGISIHQRLRFVWVLGVCIVAACGLRRRESPLSLGDDRSESGGWRHRSPYVLAAITFVELVVVTWRYNPPSKPHEVYPTTGAIAFLQQAPRPSRMAALGWSFLPETPGFYGLEDIKATDPVQHATYMQLLRGYLELEGYDQVIGNVERPFFDYLNVRYLYVPPGQDARPQGFVEWYRGADGVVLENVEALPRYFFATNVKAEGDRGATIFRSRAITDYRLDTLVDRSPFAEAQFAGGQLRVAQYEANRTLLDVVSRGENLVVTSDVHWAGWRAYWNGVRRDVVTVNGAFVGVFVPDGRGTLELRYWPDELTHGLMAGAIGLVLLLGYLTSRSSRMSSSRCSRPRRDQTL